MAGRASTRCYPGAGGGRCSQPEPDEPTGTPPGPNQVMDRLGSAMKGGPPSGLPCFTSATSSGRTLLLSPPSGHLKRPGTVTGVAPPDLPLSLLNQWKGESLLARSPLGAHHKVSFSEDRLHRHLVGLPIARQPDGFDGREQLRDAADAVGGGGDMALAGAGDVEWVQEGAVVANVELAVGRVLSGVVVGLWRGGGRGRGGGGGGDTTVDAQEGEDGDEDDEGKVDEDEGSGDGDGNS